MHTKKQWHAGILSDSILQNVYFNVYEEKKKTQPAHDTDIAV